MTDLSAWTLARDETQTDAPGDDYSVVLIPPTDGAAPTTRHLDHLADDLGVPEFATEAPKPTAGAADRGISSRAARGDHVHAVGVHGDTVDVPSTAVAQLAGNGVAEFDTGLDYPYDTAMKIWAKLVLTDGQASADDINVAIQVQDDDDDWHGNLLEFGVITDDIDTTPMITVYPASGETVPIELKKNGDSLTARVYNAHGTDTIPACDLYLFAQPEVVEGDVLIADGEGGIASVPSSGRFRGAWDHRDTYDRGDMVTNAGDWLFLCKADRVRSSTGPAVDRNNWEQVSSYHGDWEARWYGFGSMVMDDGGLWFNVAVRSRTDPRPSEDRDNWLRIDNRSEPLRLAPFFTFHADDGQTSGFRVIEPRIQADSLIEGTLFAVSVAGSAPIVYQTWQEWPAASSFSITVPGGTTPTGYRVIVDKWHTTLDRTLPAQTVAFFSANTDGDLMAWFAADTGYTPFRIIYLR